MVEPELLTDRRTSLSAGPGDAAEQGVAEDCDQRQQGEFTAGGDVVPRFLSFGFSIQISVKLSMKFTSREFSLKRMPSRKQSGVFGVKINVVTK